VTRDPREGFAVEYLSTLERLVREISAADLGRALAALESAHREGRQVFILGNGGSAATASHMANDLSWGLARAKLKPMRVVALTDNVALMTAIANDSGYDEVFTHQLEALAQPRDLVVAFSGSGNSPNVVKALEAARRMSLATVGFLGMDGGKAKALVDVAVVVPSNDYGPIEDLHVVFDHLATAYLRKALAQ
jgi:D-sedoheptulose 7-phosphate isomerase